MEASPTGNESKGSNPWETAWNDMKTAVTEAVEPVKKAVQAPWEMVWGSKSPSQQKPAVAPPIESKQPDRFNTVFDALIQTESKGKHYDEQGNLLTSSRGAQGITQLLPATAEKPGYGITGVKNNTEAEYKRVGKEYLRAMLDKFGGDYEKALAAYNAGVGNVEKAITKGGEDWKKYLPRKSETIPYINKILGQ